MVKIRILQNLIFNDVENLKIYDYWSLVSMTTSLTQHLNTILIFLCLFINTYMDRINSSELVILSEVITFLGYMSWMIYVRLKGSSFRYEGFTNIFSKAPIFYVGKQTAKSAIVFIITLLAISPILKTLTEDVSSDTIWTMAFFCFIVNVVFADYRRDIIWKGKDADAFALNAAVFASVILASRLPSNIHVFGITSFAVNWFGLLPIYTRSLKKFSPLLYHLIFTIGFTTLTLYLVYDLDYFWFMSYCISYSVLSFVIPLIYNHLQRLKKYAQIFMLYSNI